MNVNNFMDDVIKSMNGGSKKSNKVPKDVYCGADKVPKGKKAGSLQQCMNRGEVRLWGKMDKLNYNKEVIQYHADMAEKRLQKSSGGRDSEFIMRTIVKFGKMLDKVNAEIKATKEALKNNKYDKTKAVNW